MFTGDNHLSPEIEEKKNLARKNVVQYKPVNERSDQGASFWYHSLEMRPMFKGLSLEEIRAAYYEGHQPVYKQGENDQGFNLTPLPQTNPLTGQVSPPHVRTTVVNEEKEEEKKKKEMKIPVLPNVLKGGELLRTEHVYVGERRIGPEEKDINYFLFDRKNIFEGMNKLEHALVQKDHTIRELRQQLLSSHNQFSRFCESVDQEMRMKEMKINQMQIKNELLVHSQTPKKPIKRKEDRIVRLLKSIDDVLTSQVKNPGVKFDDTGLIEFSDRIVRTLRPKEISQRQIWGCREFGKNNILLVVDPKVDLNLTTFLSSFEQSLSFQGFRKKLDTSLNLLVKKEAFSLEDEKDESEGESSSSSDDEEFVNEFFEESFRDGRNRIVSLIENHIIPQINNFFEPKDVEVEEMKKKLKNEVLFGQMTKNSDELELEILNNKFHAYRSKFNFLTDPSVDICRRLGVHTNMYTLLLGNLQHCGFQRHKSFLFKIISDLFLCTLKPDEDTGFVDCQVVRGWSNLSKKKSKKSWKLGFHEPRKSRVGKESRISNLREAGDKSWKKNATCFSILRIGSNYKVEYFIIDFRTLKCRAVPSFFNGDPSGIRKWYFDTFERNQYFRFFSKDHNVFNPNSEPEKKVDSNRRTGTSAQFINLIESFITQKLSPQIDEKSDVFASDPLERKVKAFEEPEKIKESSAEILKTREYTQFELILKKRNRKMGGEEFLLDWSEEEKVLEKMCVVRKYFPFSKLMELGSEKIVLDSVLNSLMLLQFVRKDLVCPSAEDILMLLQENEGAKSVYSWRLDPIPRALGVQKEEKKIKKEVKKLSDILSSGEAKMKNWDDFKTDILNIIFQLTRIFQYVIENYRVSKLWFLDEIECFESHVLLEIWEEKKETGFGLEVRKVWISDELFVNSMILDSISRSRKIEEFEVRSIGVIDGFRRLLRALLRKYEKEFDLDEMISDFNRFCGTDDEEGSSGEENFSWDFVLGMLRKHLLKVKLKL